MNADQRKTLAQLLPNALPESALIVPRGNLPEQLLAEIEPADTVKLLVAGQKGMGKTTELRRLVDLLLAEERFVPVFLQFGSQETITEAGLLYAMAGALYGDERAKLGADDIAPIQHWFEDEEVSTVLEEGSEGKAGLGGNLYVLEAGTRITRKRGKRVQRKRAVVKNKRDLLKHFNDLITKARKKTKKRVVFIVDDIDKVQNDSSIESTFIHAAHLIGEIDCPCVFTVPITYATSNYVRMGGLPYNELYRMPAVALFGEDGTRNEGEFQFMRAVFERRMPFNPLSAPLLDRVLEYSGGVLVDAMRLLRNISKAVILEPTLQINEALVDREFQKMVDDYRYVFDKRELWEKLHLYCETNDKSVFMTDNLMLELLHKVVIIEYREAKMWFDLHPAARRCYEQNAAAIRRLVEPK